MGGGGGSSGKVGYAAYLEGAHTSLIGEYHTYTYDQNVAETINTMMATSPYATLVAFDPSTDLTAMISALSVYETAIDDLVASTSITAEVDAFSDILDDDINTKVLPSFNARMRDIGAVISSSYAVGVSNILSMRDRDVAKYTSSLRMKREDMAYAGREVLMKSTLEVRRMTIAAKNDQSQINNELDVHDAGWDIDCLLKAGQILGCLGGGTHIPDKPSKLSSALSGALSGAAMGTMVAPGIGTAIGGALGAAAAFA